MMCPRPNRVETLRHIGHSAVTGYRGPLEHQNGRRRARGRLCDSAKGTPSLQTIPVVILITSRPEADILKSYLLHANCFITKPVNLDGFLRVVKSIDNFWLSVVRLPPEVSS